MYALRFSTNALCRIQDALGRSLVEVLREQIRQATTDVGMVDTQRAIAEALGLSQGHTVNAEWRQIRVNAAALGIYSDRFWSMTLDDLSVAREGSALFWREVYNALIFHAWHVEAFARTKGMLPSLESLMKKPEPPKAPMSPDVAAAEEDMNWRVQRAVLRRKAALKKTRIPRQPVKRRGK